LALLGLEGSGEAEDKRGETDQGTVVWDVSFHGWERVGVQKSRPPVPPVLLPPPKPLPLALLELPMVLLLLS